MSVETPARTTVSVNVNVAVPAWIRRDPLHVVAAVLIVASVVWRASITTRGYLAADDFVLISQADSASLSVGHLFELYNNHLMPAGRLVMWLVQRVTELEYWPYATLMVAGQAAVSITFYRLLRLMLPATWALLVPLCLFLFCPLTLEISAWWAVGVNLLPMQLALIMAITAQIRYIRTRQPRHLAALGGWVVFGLVFFEKSLLIVALVALLTVCLYAPGGPVRAVVTAIRRWPLSWLVLAGVSAAFLAMYLTLSTSSLREPSSGREVATFLQQFFGQSVSAGMLGGPWSWLDTGDGPAVAAPTSTAQRISWVLVLALVALTLWLRRGVALRAWTLLLLYSSLSAAVIGATRLGSAYSGVAGLVPRYIGDVLVVAAICVGVALCGLRPVDEEAEPPVPALPRRFGGALAAGTALLVASSLYSGVDFGTDWASKLGRDYVKTAKAGIAEAPAGTVFWDLRLPATIVDPLSYPWNMQSRFFASLDHDPVFVTQGRQLWVFDDSGKVRPAWVKGVKARPGPAEGCGYQIAGGQTVTVPLAGTVTEYWQAVRIAYIVDRDTKATLRLGTGEVRSFDAHRGLNAAFMLVWGGGSQVEVTMLDPQATFCTDEIEIGQIVPQPVG